MAEKTLAEIAEATRAQGDGWNWEAVADAVISAHESRRWKAIESFGEADVSGTCGRWLDGKWETCAGYLYLPYWKSQGWTHVYVADATIPAPPKEKE
jgi:hypothetical protein